MVVVVALCNLIFLSLTMYHVHAMLAKNCSLPFPSSLICTFNILYEHFKRKRTFFLTFYSLFCNWKIIFCVVWFQFFWQVCFYVWFPKCELLGHEFYVWIICFFSFSFSFTNYFMFLPFCTLISSSFVYF